MVVAQCPASITSAENQPNIIDFTNTSSPQNPASTMYSWDFGDTIYVLTDLAGRTVMNGAVQTNTVNVSALPGGVFFFTLVKENGQTEPKRFIRELILIRQNCRC